MAKTITITFNIAYGTAEELKEVRGKTEELGTLHKMCLNELKQIFSGDIPAEINSGVLTVSFAKQKHREPIKQKGK